MLNKDIISSFEGLQKLRQAASRRLPARTSFAIVRNIKTLQPIVEDIQTAYNELIMKYAEPIEGDKFRVKEENMSEFTTELNSLYNLDTEVPIVKIKFTDIENLDFSLEETEALYFMIEDEEA